MKRVIFTFMFLFMFLLVACSGTNDSEAKDAVANDTAGENSSSDFPEKPIEMIVPYPPGGNSDTVSRIFAEAASKYLPNDQNIVVVNKEGAGGTIGMTELAGADPDGYTIAQATASQISVEPLKGETSYTAEDIQPILTVTTIPQMMVVRKDAPWDTFEEWLEYVKENPGEFSYGMVGIGNSQHVVQESLNLNANIETEPIPYEGSADAYTAFLAGEIDGVITYPAVLDHDDIKVLYNFASERSSFLPDVPTVAEKGYDDRGSSAYIGFVAPKGVDEERLQIIHDAFKQALDDPEVQEQLEEMKYEPMYYGIEEFQEIIDSETENNKIVMEELGLIN